MVNAEFASEERGILLGYAPAHARAGIAALFALDDQLGSVLRSTREPMVGQMRLTWWHGALEALDTAPPPAEPVLQALAANVVPAVPGADLARQVEGWEELLDPAPLDDDRLSRYADLRGGALFDAVAWVTGAAPGDPVRAAGQGWALADLADHVSDARTAERARALSVEPLRRARAARWPTAGRVLGAMAHLAAMPDASPPRRAGRMLWHRLTGR